MTEKSKLRSSLEARLMSLFVSLFFSIPTAAFIWFGVNKSLAYVDAGFLGSGYLIVAIVIGAVIALLCPKLFPAMLGATWRGILKVQRWWGW